MKNFQLNVLIISISGPFGLAPEIHSYVVLHILRQLTRLNLIF